MFSDDYMIVDAASVIKPCIVIFTSPMREPRLYRNVRIVRSRELAEELANRYPEWNPRLYEVDVETGETIPLTQEASGKWHTEGLFRTDGVTSQEQRQQRNQDQLKLRQTLGNANGYIQDWVDEFLKSKGLETDASGL